MNKSIVPEEKDTKFANPEQDEKQLCSFYHEEPRILHGDVWERLVIIVTLPPQTHDCMISQDSFTTILEAEIANKVAPSIRKGSKLIAMAVIVMGLSYRFPVEACIRRAVDKINGRHRGGITFIWRFFDDEQWKYVARLLSETKMMVAS